VTTVGFTLGRRWQLPRPHLLNATCDASGNGEGERQ
jgi:hypothetical protein